MSGETPSRINVPPPINKAPTVDQREQPNPFSPLQAFAKQLSLLSQTPDYLVVEKESGKDLFDNTAGISGDRYSSLELGALKALDSVTAIGFEKPLVDEIGPLNQLDRTFHFQDAVKLSGFLITVANVLNNPDTDEKAFTEQFTKQLESASAVEPSVDIAQHMRAEMLNHLDSFGYIPIQSELGRAVALPDLISAIDVLIQNPRHKSIYAATMRAVYNRLLNDPPSPPPPPPDRGPRPGGGGNVPRRRPGGGSDGGRGCGCGSFNWDTDKASELEELLKKGTPEPATVPEKEKVAV